MPTEHQKRIVEFMRKAGQEVPKKPVDLISMDVLLLRARLILEEAFETIDALGCIVVDRSSLEGAHVSVIYNDKDPDIEGIIDGCADLSVVTIGTLAALGVDDEPVLKEVDEANLRKFGPGSYRREDGKWMKPPDFVPPDVMAAAARGEEL